MVLTTTGHPAAPAAAPVATDLTETIWSQWGLFKRVRRYLRGFLYRIPDTGLFGLTPLRTHILICGYQRAGTTLLLAMMEYAIPKARRFGEETSGWRAATYSWRNHAVMISKVPNDVLKLHQVRNFYKDRKAKLKVIILVRDPRDVLTSKMKAVDLVKYATDLGEWREYHAHVRLYLNDPDVLLLRYEDLVSDTDDIQRRIDAFTGEPTERPMKDFHKADRSDFDTTPLNGVRPVDRNTVGRWATAEHAGRIEQILREVPDFPQILRELGYEQDDSWVDRWKAGVGK